MMAGSTAARAWPEDLVRAIYSLGLKKYVLTLKDRLRGLAVCRSWLSALSDLPIRKVSLSDYDVAFCRWIIKTQPSVLELHLLSTLDVAVQALSSVQHNDLHQLAWHRPLARGQAVYDIQRAFPVPSLFPNLRELRVGHPVVNADWVAELGALKHLESLDLVIEFEAKPAAAAMPRLDRLTYLRLSVQPGTVVLLHLALFPSLTKLSLAGLEGRATLLTAKPVPQLHHLDCGDLGCLSADFAALPGLRSAQFDGSIQLDQPHSIAAATALTMLGLRGFVEDAVALELLTSLPPSVSCLELNGVWTAETAALAGGMRGLVGLALCWEGRGKPRLPPVAAPIWAGLRAFSWDTLAVDGVRVPQALKEASKLEALQVLSAASVKDLDLISSLPALKKLTVATRESTDDSYGAAIQRLEQRALPTMLLLKADNLRRYYQFLGRGFFFEWAFSSDGKVFFARRR